MVAVADWVAEMTERPTRAQLAYRYFASFVIAPIIGIAAFIGIAILLKAIGAV